jgi:hypothetical protein
MAKSSGSYKKGNIPWTKGKHHKRETKIKMGGENQWLWKGDAVGYRGLHQWVARWKGNSDTCEICGKSGLKGHQIQWANIDHKYRRVLNDYIRVCCSCHTEYDVKNNNRKLYDKAYRESKS